MDEPGLKVEILVIRLNCKVIKALQCYIFITCELPFLFLIFVTIFIIYYSKAQVFYTIILPFICSSRSA